MKIAVGADHAGWELKARIAQWLGQRGHEVMNFGTDGPQSVDYPDVAREVAECVARADAERGVLVCGTGVGMAMTANTVRGARAVNCIDGYTAGMGRAHNDANILCLGARVIGSGLAEHLLEIFLETPFEGDRHLRRVAKIDP